ncbi:MAG: acetyl-CoA carboxylase carboxyltransferase subunit beta [Candidatus Eisenbacteria bacterium]|nr:acetyl-CoA carboxylase carboxyltransferase subunit beta [Candidatus Eisenbacteria bacterium]
MDQVPWLKRRKPAIKEAPRREVPDGLWRKCEGCGEIIYHKELERGLWTCARCGYHFQIGAEQYRDLLVDEGSFVELLSGIEPTDPLGFVDSKRYSDRLDAAKRKSGLNEAVHTGSGRIDGHLAMLALLEFAFLGGSMGSVMGEKIARLTRMAIEERVPLVTVSSTGGARMQEGIFSLMQMAKTSAMLARLHEEGLLHIAIQAHPTTGGVTASFASLGDIIIAEPGALIGFAGPRVIQQTIKQDLPGGFQRAEFMLSHGMVDMVVRRKDLKRTVSRVLAFFADEGRDRAEDALDQARRQGL